MNDSGDFTLEVWWHPNRQVRYWRGKRMVFRKPYCTHTWTPG